MSRQAFSLFLLIVVLLSSIIVYFDFSANSFSGLLIALVAFLAVVDLLNMLGGKNVVGVRSLFFLSALVFALHNFIQGVATIELFVSSSLSVVGLLTMIAAPRRRRRRARVVETVVVEKPAKRTTKKRAKKRSTKKRAKKRTTKKTTKKRAKRRAKR